MHHFTTKTQSGLKLFFRSFIKEMKNFQNQKNKNLKR